MKYYHVTQKENLESILKNGLVRGKLLKGIYLFDVKEDSQISINEAARLLARQLRLNTSDNYYVDWVLLEIDSTGFDDKIIIDPFIRMDLDWFNIKWGQYKVDIDVISPDHIKFVEEFDIATRLSDNLEYLGYFFKNIGDLMFVEAIKQVAQYIEDGTLETALQMGHGKDLLKQAEEVRKQIIKLFPDDPDLMKLTDIQLITKIVELKNQQEDFDILNSIRSQELSASINNKTTSSQIEAFVKSNSNDDHWKSVIHGLQHWQHVELFGVLMCRLSENADEDVIRWFAYLHDCKRTNDGHDQDHGKKAADYISEIRNTYLSDLTDSQIQILKTACELHTTTHKTDDPTVNICFDADRLDLLRVGTIIDPTRLASSIGVKLLRYPYHYLIEFATEKVGKDCMTVTL